MLAGVMIEIDQLSRLRDPGERRVHRVLDVDHERHHGAIVRHVGRHVEDRYPFDAADRIDDLRDDLRTATFREVRNALDKLHSS
jgi:hypothetical protein